VYSLEVIEEVTERDGEANEGEADLGKEGEQNDSPFLLSLNALNGVAAYQTMRVTGKVKTTPLHILIDSGSTHNFLDLATAKRLHCHIKKIPPLQVVVANGQQLACTSVCHNFAWSLLGEVFTTDVILIPLGSCEMVLGIQWLTSLGPILWDFEKLRMEFQKEGRRIVLRGTQKSEVEWMGGKKWQHSIQKNTQLYAIHVQCTYQALGVESDETAHSASPEVHRVLQQYADIFEEPKTLPPHRDLDHKIILHPGTPPVNV